MKIDLTSYQHRCLAVFDIALNEYIDCATGADPESGWYEYAIMLQNGSGFAVDDSDNLLKTRVYSDFRLIDIRDVWAGRAIPDIKSISGTYKGSPAVILGSGPSLPGDMADIERCAVKDELIYISINVRPLPLCPDAEADFIVFTDRVLWPQIKSRRERIVSVCPEYSQFKLDDADIYFNGLTYSLAVWLAVELGCTPIYLAGFDLYSDRDRHYFNNKDVHHGRGPGALKDALAGWEDLKKRFPDTDIRPASGPLLRVFTPKTIDRGAEV